MAEEPSISSRALKPSRAGAIAIYVAFVAIVLQTWVRITARQLKPWYAGLFAAYLILYSAALWQPRLRPLLLNLYFAIQCTVVLALLSLEPSSDVVLGLFALLCYQVARLFTARVRWAWLAIILSLTAGSLMFYLGPILGLARAMTPAAAGIALAFLVIANQEMDKAHRQSRELVGELEDTHSRLQIYAEQVEELAALEERNRLARELHDSVSQIMFSINLTARSAQILLERNPAKARPLLEQLHSMTANVLADLRSLVAKLRPTQA